MNKINRLLNTAYLLYLGALPTLATFFLIQKIGGGSEAFFRLIFILGIAIVATYLAIVISYSKPIKSTARLSLIFLDGPVRAIMASIRGMDIPHIIITTFFIENIAIRIAIGIASMRFEEPTKGQITASIILSLVCIGGLGGLYYGIGFFEKTRYTYLPILLGIAETVWIKYKVLEDDNVNTEVNDTGFILGFLTSWIIVLFVSIGMMK